MVSGVRGFCLLCVHSHRAEREMMNSAVMIILSFSWNWGGIAHGMMWATPTLGIPTLINLTEVISHRRAQRLIFKLVLNPVKSNSSVSSPLQRTPVCGPGVCVLVCMFVCMCACVCSCVSVEFMCHSVTIVIRGQPCQATIIPFHLVWDRVSG